MRLLIANLRKQINDYFLNIYLLQNHYKDIKLEKLETIKLNNLNSSIYQETRDVLLTKVEELHYYKNGILLILTTDTLSFFNYDIPKISKNETKKHLDMKVKELFHDQIDKYSIKIDKKRLNQKVDHYRIIVDTKDLAQFYEPLMITTKSKTVTFMFLLEMVAKSYCLKEQVKYNFIFIFDDYTIMGLFDGEVLNEIYLINEGINSFMLPFINNACKEKNSQYDQLINVFHHHCDELFRDIINVSKTRKIDKYIFLVYQEFIDLAKKHFPNDTNIIIRPLEKEMAKGCKECYEAK